MAIISKPETKDWLNNYDQIFKPKPKPEVKK